MPKTLSPSRGARPFEQDARQRQGYRYTTGAPLSSLIANQRLTSETLRWLKETRIKYVLDIGCGDGVYTHQLQQARPRLQIAGCDPARTAIAVARKSFPSILFQYGDILKPRTLPQPAPTGVILRGVIHHVPKPAQGVANAIRYCGRTQIIEPNGWNLLLKIIEVVSPYHRQHGERSFTSWTLKRWVEAGGGSVNRVYYVGLVPFFCPSWLVPILKKIEPLIEHSWLAPLLCAQVIIETG